MRIAFILLSLLVPVAVVGQPNDVERFLVPIHLAAPAPGAFGSVWLTELRILNVGATMAFVENLGYDSPVGFGRQHLVPGVETSGRLLNSGGDNVSNPGSFLLVRRVFIPQLRFQARVRDISRESDGWGTWIPVVHESEARTDAVHLLDVPIDLRYRQMLRVYSFVHIPGATVRVRVFATREDPFAEPDADALIAEVRMPLSGNPVGGLEPAYGEIWNLSDLPGVAGATRVRVSVEPEGSFAIWAMVSVTNNVTQQVTMITPN
jgi:hypothetical protein